MEHRRERLDSLIQEELSKLIIRELDFRGALVTITGVEVSRKLETAEIKIGVVPQEKEKSVMRILERMRSQLQFLLLRKLNIKPMPQIHFGLDTGAAKAVNIEKLLESQ